MFPAFRVGRVAGLAPRLLSRLTIAPRAVLRVLPARSLSVSAPLSLPTKTTTKRAAVRKAPVKKTPAAKKKPTTSRGGVAAAKKKPTPRAAAKKPTKKAAAAKKPRKVVKKKPAPLPALPTVPKRGTNAFAMFIGSKKPFPVGRPATEYVTVLSAEWRALSDEGKKPFVELAATKNEQRKLVYQEFVDNIDSTTLRRLNAKRKAKGHTKIHVPQERRRPATAYIRFYTEQIKAGTIAAPEGLSRQQAFSSMSSSASVKWRQLSDAEKAPYVESYTRDLEAFKRANP